MEQEVIINIDNVMEVDAHPLHETRHEVFTWDEDIDKFVLSRYDDSYPICPKCGQPINSNEEAESHLDNCENDTLTVNDTIKTILELFNDGIVISIVFKDEEEKTIHIIKKDR